VLPAVKENKMAEYTVVGRRIPRVDAFSKVTGEAIYSGDVLLPNMLHGKILRCPYPHAKLLKLDITKAKAVPGVKAVITADDVPGYKHKSTLLFDGLPHLAKDKAVYAEQPVAVVAAVSVKVAEEALKLIEVEYEVLTPILDVEEAGKPDAPLIHNDLFTNITTLREPQKNDQPSNIAHSLIINRGDLEEGFKNADIVIEKTFKTCPVNQGYVEPIASIAEIDPDGKIIVWTQSQGIFEARNKIAEFLDIPFNKIVLKQVEIGGAFGGKGYLPVAPLCALLAVKTGRPVRMELTRDEVMKDGRPAAACRASVKLGATKDGYLSAFSLSLTYDSGAYPEHNNCMFVWHNCLGQYKIPNLKIEAKDVLTNKIPTSAYRAPATPQNNFAIEASMDMAAEVLKMDPIQFRIKNINQEGDLIPNGQKLPPVGFKQALETMADYIDKQGSLKGDNRGRGIACCFWGSATGGYGASVNIASDGTISVVLGTTDVSGSRTSLAQIAAEELQVPFESIALVTGDTETAPWATSSVGSLTVYCASIAICRACRDALAQLSALAARKLEVDIGQIEYSKGMFQVKDNPTKRIPLRALAAITAAFWGAGPIIGRGTTGNLPDSPVMAVHAADVEVDKETGKIKVLSFAVVQDVGKAINPMSIEGQIQGAVVQGIGWSLMEGYSFDNGIILNDNLMDYRLPTASDVPMIDANIIEVASKNGVYGLRHVGEPPMIPTLAAITNAVYAATGVRFNELPMNPEAVYNGLNPSQP
jgi:xanthine dehydrogenase molybdenum-binding subunit